MEFLSCVSRVRQVDRHMTNSSILIIQIFKSSCSVYYLSWKSYPVLDRVQFTLACEFSTADTHTRSMPWSCQFIAHVIHFHHWEFCLSVHYNTSSTQCFYFIASSALRHDLWKYYHTLHRLRWTFENSYMLSSCSYLLSPLSLSLNTFAWLSSFSS